MKTKREVLLLLSLLWNCHFFYFFFVLAALLFFPCTESVNPGPSLRSKMWSGNKQD